MKLYIKKVNYIAHTYITSTFEPSLIHYNYSYTSSQLNYVNTVTNHFFTHLFKLTNTNIINMSKTSTTKEMLQITESITQKDGLRVALSQV